MSLPRPPTSSDLPAATPTHSAAADPAGADMPVDAPGRAPAMSTPAPNTAINPATGLPKLRPGELQAQVLTVLASDPHAAFSIGEITKRLHGRSTGAVGQACERLSALGHVNWITELNPTAGAAAKTAARFSITATGLAEHTRRPGPAPVPPVAPPTTPKNSSSAPRSTRPSTPAAAAPGASRPSAPPTPPPTPPSKPRATVTTGPVRRPNGQLYYPRRLAKRTDVDVLRELRTVEVPVLLYGPPGTGKTSLVEAAFGDELYTVSGDGDTTVGDVIGDYVPTAAGGYDLIPGPLPQAMGAGGVLFIDDATLIDPKVLAVVYPAMDGRRQVTLKAAGGMVFTARPGFYVVAGHNPGVHGAVLTEALSSRFSAQIEVSTDYDLAAALGVDPRMVRAARNLSTRHRSGDIGWAPQLRELLAFKKLTDTLGIDTALANLVGVAPVEDRDAVVKAIRQNFASTTVEPLALGKQL